MASVSRSGSSRRKPEVPGKIRLQLKINKSSRTAESEDEEVLEDQNDTKSPDKEGSAPVDQSIPDDLPEGTVVVQPQAVEDMPLKKKKEAPVRIDTSILDNVSCTACGRQLNPYKSSALQKHPELKVVICKRCEKFLSSGEIAKDKDGTDEQCRWCGEGGRLVVCDQCTSAFCRACVMRNFNRSEFTSINSQTNWKCYLCDKAPLQGLREKYRKIRDTLKALQAREKAKANGTGTSENSVGSKKPSSKSVPSASGAKKVSTNGSSSVNSLQGDILALTDFTVNFDNVDIVMDKVSTATNTFRSMLTALRSQFHSTSPCKPDDTPPLFQFSFSRSMDLTEKKRRCAKAFDMGLQTYLKSLVSILSHTQSTDLAVINDKKNVTVASPKKSLPSVSNDVSEISKKSTLKSLDEPKKSATSVKKTSDMSISLDTKKSDQVDKLKNKTVTENKNKTVTENKTAIENKVVKKSKKENDPECVNDSVLTSVDEPLGDKAQESKKTNKTQGKDKKEKLTEEKSDKDNLSEDLTQDPSLREVTPVKTTHSGDKTTDKLQEDNLPEHSESDLHSEESITAKKDDGEKVLDEQVVDENLAAKNDLLKEMADLDESMEIGETSADVLVGTELEAKSSEKNEKTDKSATVKKSNELKKKNENDKPRATKSKDASSASTSKTEKKSKKNKEDTDDRDSDSDLLYISEEDDDPAQKQANSKKKVMESKATGLKLKISTKLENSGPATSKDKTEVNGKEAAEDNTDEIDKEIDKLSKLPTVRKRKVKDVEESVEDIGKSEPEKKVPRLSKPGPKSSKKNNDYDDLSSDGEEKIASEHETDDDDDGPTVTFFVEPDKPEDNEEENNIDKENEMAKNGLLEDMDNDKDSSDDNDSSSSDESMKTEKEKTVLKKDKVNKDEDDQKESKDEESDDDSIRGKKKQIRNRLLDSKLSESDSDVSEPKKKKKGEDSDGDSSDSSIPSDLSDEDDDDKDEDGEDDDSDSKKKKKGKKKGKKKRKGKGKKGSSDDDDKGSDEDEEDGKKKKKGKGRRRIKKMSESSEDGERDDEDDEDGNDNKSGKRKQIRKVMSNKKLEDSTKAAARAEEKRRRRIAAKQREFNIETITDENNPMNCPITTKLVLERGKEEGDEPVIQVNLKLVRKLKPHQVEAVQFMWDCLYESVKRSKKEHGAGCILAHCMGLGKTLSVIAFVHTVLSHEKILKHKTCLVVSPLNTVLNWKNEWGMWLDEEDQFKVWELASCKQNAARSAALREWQGNGGIMIIGYEMYRNLTTGSRCKNKRQKKVFFETLVDPGPDMVICDEGHILKNEASAISKAMNQMRTKRRVVLTGTPLQNNLNEYHCMVTFVKPNLLGTRKEFNNRFISPIQNGQCTDSTPRDVKLMKARAHILHEMLAGCVQRRDYSALTKFLPPKQEYVISVRLTNIQIELYEKYMELTGQGQDGIFSNKGARLFTDYQNLMKIWTHPWVLKLAEIRDESKVKFDDDDSFIDDDESDEERSFSSTNSTSDDEKKEAMSDSGGEGTSSKPSLRGGTKRTRAKARRLAGEDSDPEEVIAEWKSKTRGKEPENDGLPEEQDKAVTKEWWAQFVTEDDKNKLELSNKLFLLFEILKMCEEIGDKVLIFSQSILSLNIIENFLETIDSKYQQECEAIMKDSEDAEKESFGKCWTKHLDYYRMDGTTSAQNRQLWASNFNDIENYRARLFLISTRAGGLGINLVAANRVIIFDASWNPSHDVQSIFRVYRFGQTKPCYIYRFLAQGTMEEKIYDRQVAKLSLSQRVVDEHQIERHFSANDLKELYNFRPDRWDDGTEKPTLALPKDPLLAEILQSNRQCVVSFHEHDSLLENQVDQNLTEEEKKAAWEEYENEKKGIIVRGPGMERTASWPLMAAAQILSRDEITATVHALRLQLPDVPEEIFHLHVQQTLRRQVQLKQEELRRMEMLRIQEMNYLNMIKHQTGMSHAQSIQALQNMAPWMQIQRLRAMQNQMMMGGSSSLHPSASMSMLGLSSQESAERISNKPEEAIDLDEN